MKEKILCASCKFFKLSANPQTKEIAKVCYANPPVLTPVQTQQGMGFLTIRPQVLETDFCRLHEPDFIKPILDS